MRTATTKRRSWRGRRCLVDYGSENDLLVDVGNFVMATRDKEFMELRECVAKVVSLAHAKHRPPCTGNLTPVTRNKDCACGLVGRQCVAVEALVQCIK